VQLFRLGTTGAAAMAYAPSWRQVPAMVITAHNVVVVADTGTGTGTDVQEGIAIKTPH
jgi:hypothetical protein